MPALSCSAWAANGSQTLGTANQEGENSCKTDEGGRGPPRSRSLTACVIAAAFAAAPPPPSGAGGRAGRVGIMTKVTSTCAPQSLSSLAVPPRPSALQTVPKPEETSTSFIPRRNGGLESGQTRSSHFPSPSQSRLGWDGTREPDMHSGLSGSFQASNSNFNFNFQPPSLFLLPTRSQSQNATTTSSRWPNAATITRSGASCYKVQWESCLTLVHVGAISAQQGA